VRGVGEVPIVPPTAAVGNAISRAIGIRMTDLPMSPPKLSEAIDVAAPRMAATDHGVRYGEKIRRPSRPPFLCAVELCAE
jgi:hypothetical protein